MDTHDFASEERRRTRTRITRMYLNNYLIHGSLHELEKAISLLEYEALLRKAELELEGR